jgi:hypothetical protein
MTDNGTRDALVDTWFIICLRCDAQGPAYHDGSEGWGRGGLPSDSWLLGNETETECRSKAILGWNRREGFGQPS